MVKVRARNRLANLLEFNGENEEWYSFPHTKHTINSKWILDLNKRTKNIKLLEEDVIENLYDLGLGTEFLDVTPKAYFIKEKKS